MKAIPVSRLPRTAFPLGVALFLLVPGAFADALDNWSTNQVSTNRFGLDCVVHGNGRYVAYGEYSDFGAIMSSEDGKTWTLRLDGATDGSGFSYSLGLQYVGNRFFALGGFGASAQSTNGVDWSVFTHHENGLNSAYFWSVAYGAARYVLVGSPSLTTGFNAYSSNDGITWTSRNTTAPANADLGDVAFGAGMFVAVGGNNGFVDDSGHIYTSTTGISWTQRSVAGGRLVSFCNGFFIIPLVAGTNLVSADGINWATIHTGVTNTLGRVNFANGLFMARAGVYLATSTNGTNWIQYPQALPGTNLRGYQIASDGSRLVTVGGIFAGLGNVYDGFTYLSEPLVDLGMASALPPILGLSGIIGRSYKIEYRDSLPTSGNTDWQTLTTLQLPSSPYPFTDTTATNSSMRFYRGVLLP